MDGQALHAALIGIEDLEAEPVRALHHLSQRRDAAGERDDQATQRIDVVGDLIAGQIDAGGSLQLGQRRAGVRREAVLAGRDDWRLLEIMLVLDIADDDLDQVLDRDEAVGPAIFVDDERDICLLYTSRCV